MRRDEAEARDRRRAIGRPEAVDGPDELGKVGSAVEVEPSAGRSLRGDVAEAGLGRQVVPVRVDVLAEEGDLAIAGRRE